MRNDIILPQYTPNIANSDFLGDLHLQYFEHYLLAVFAMDKYAGLDI